MARIINLNNKLENEPTFIKIGEKDYKVNDSYQAVIKASALFEQKGIENMMAGIEILLGKEGRKAVEGMPMGNIYVVMNGLSAAISGESYEDAEARFQEEGKSEN